MNLRVKIGIAVGCVIFYHIANEHERHFGEAGDTIQEVNIAQSSASSGTVVVRGGERDFFFLSGTAVVSVGGVRLLLSK